MKTIISATARHHCIDAIERMIVGHERVCDELVKHIETYDDPKAPNHYDNALQAAGAIGVATKKLCRYHPEAEMLTITNPMTVGIAFDIAAQCARERPNKTNQRKWQADCVDAIKKHVADILERLANLKQSLCKTGKSNPRDKYCYERLKKGDSLKAIMEAVNDRPTWEPLYTSQAVSQASRRYAQKHGKPWPLR
ncbi:MAG: hypothetical protein FJ303_22185 [Planctomycetes bacterium]|nr:hypothetical protein [Planctomycetota bacterium]